MLGMVMVLAAGAALANAPVDPTSALPQTTVRYGDLDLGTAKGVKSLEARVRSAQYELCGDVSTRDLTQLREVRACRAAVIASARPQTEVAINRAHAGASLIAAAAAVVGK